MEILDLTGLRCPMPLLKLKQRLHTLATNQCIEVLTTDSGALRDFPLFLHQAGHQLEQVTTNDEGVSRFTIRRS